MKWTHQGGSSAGRVRGVVLALWLVVAGAHCHDDRDEAVLQEYSRDTTTATGSTAFHRMFAITDSILLEERADVVTVSPVLFMDPQGGFLVADRREHQVRVYSGAGALEAVAGGGLHGTDSLRRPHGVDRLSNGDIISTTLAPGRLVIVPTREEKAVRFIPVPLTPLRGVRVLDAHHVLLTGKDAPYPTNLLHIWDTQRGEIVRSFFPPPIGLDSIVVSSLGRAHVALRGNRLAVIHELSDTLHVFDRRGNRVSRVRIPVESFVFPVGPPPPSIGSIPEAVAWSDRFTFLSDVFWRDNGAIVVQWSLGSGDSLTWGLVQMDTLGQKMWMLPRTPRLLGLRDGRFFFQDPNPGSPNRLMVAQLRLNSRR